MNPPAAHSESDSNLAGPATPNEINRSCCWPVTFLFTASVGWLIAACVLGLISAIKLHSAGFLADSQWLTYGRVQPAYSTALIFGFASQAGIAMAFWIVARLSRAILFGPLATTIAGLFWNLGVLVGVFGILAGHGTGHEWLEVPGYASPVLFFSYVVMGACALITFHRRSERELYVSQWYLLSALFWFPWIYSTAQLLLICFPARGVVQTVIGGWFVHNLFTLWLGALGLGAIFYFLPKLLGRPLHSRYLAIFGFWSLLFFGSWGGVGAGTPAPSWLSSVSTAAGVMTLIPILAVAVNWHWTLANQEPKLGSNPVLPFIKFGAFCYLLSSLLSIAGLVHSPGDFSTHPADMSGVIQWTFALVSGLVGQIADVTRFTHYGNGVMALFLFGFFGMVVAGSIYYIVPKVTQCEWPSPKLVRFHYLAAAGGVVLSSGALIIGGIRQGMAVSNPVAPFLDTVRGTIPFLGMSTLGMLLLLAGNVALGVNLARLIRNCRCFECCPSAASAANRRTAAAGAGL